MPVHIQYAQHFNPAVTFATWINGDLSNRKAVSFVLAQLAGSLLACSALVGVFPEGLDAVKLIAIAPAPDAYWGKVCAAHSFAVFQ
jgi:glycerol uptake facilitator-like aquaporin